ncbi:RNA-guided endonuclease InsQ/TnpB family protein [Turicimonas muris]|uniref:Transposase n=1 Tax=Turicimonas muris TaxID=1796652 RepID=A0A227KNU6_9BURK|nr:RNA-guided endonuclease TnpB family protein [Turicimonas muris]OXE49762.1 hypothetical protein ADH67_06440 [Turicimonas muris]QQQ97259.1 transposase [Turicimonas muris]
MRVEEIRIGRNHALFPACEKACFHTRTLYNSGNYQLRQAFFKHEVVDYRKIDKCFKQNNDPLYRRMPSAASAQRTLIVLQNDWKSVFQATKQYEKHPEKFKAKPKIPRYCKGKKTFVVERNGFSVKDHILCITGLGSLKIRCVANQQFNEKKDRSVLQEVRIIPRNGIYVVHLAYKEANRYDARTVGLDSARILGIDLGVTNFATMTAVGPDTENLYPLIAKGGRLKALNQYWNKQCAELKSRKKYGHLGAKANRRAFRIKDYLHKLSHFVIEYCLNHGIGRICIGRNKDWKQEVNTGKRNNQSFVQIPHAQFVGYLRYKAESVGIEVIEVEEAYTSKASALDLDPIPEYGKGKEVKFQGKRVKRGLYRTLSGRLLNADVNGSINVIRKLFDKEVRDALLGEPAVGGRLFRPKVLDANSGTFRIRESQCSIETARRSPRL